MKDRRYIDRRYNEERRSATVGTDRRVQKENEHFKGEERRNSKNRRVSIRRLFHRREGWISI